MIIQLCAANNCQNWAQWRKSRAVYEQNHDTGEKKVLRFERVALLCGQHKREQEHVPEPDIIYNFTGAVPSEPPVTQH